MTRAINTDPHNKLHIKVLTLRYYYGRDKETWHDPALSVTSDCKVTISFSLICRDIPELGVEGLYQAYYGSLISLSKSEFIDHPSF